MRMALVGAPAYFARHAPPNTPPALASITCALPPAASMPGNPEGRRELNVHVDGTAIAGFGSACLPEDCLATSLADGCLVRVLADWC